MKFLKFITFFLALSTAVAQAADVKISQLPLGTAATTTSLDSFPYVSNAANITKRLTIYDIANIPSLVSTYAPLSNPTFTGTITAPHFIATTDMTSPVFIGALTGNALTATALAAVPTACGSNTYATSIAANGNLTCSAVSGSGGLTGIVPVANGGTGLASGTSGGILGYTATGTIASSGLLTNHALLLGAGAGAVPTALGSLGTSTTVLHGAAAGAPTFGAVGLTTDVSGALPLVNGGTGTAAASANAAFNALSPMTTVGDIIYGGASGAGTRLGSGTTGQVLQTATGAAPAWSTATYPLTTTANQLLYSSSTSVVSGLATANTGALVTSSGGVPSITSGTTANRVLRTDGTTVSFSQVAAASDISGQVPVANGGTGLASGTSGGVLAFTASGTLASSGALTQNALVLGGGAGAAPAVVASTGTTTTLLHGNAAGAPTFGAVGLTTDVSGALPLVNGGTGVAAGSANAAFNALSPMTTGGDLIYGGASGVATRLANGTSGQVLTSQGTTVAPQWVTPVANATVVASMSSSTTALTSATDTKVVFATVDYDNSSAINVGKDTFTVPAGDGGYYQICGFCVGPAVSESVGNGFALIAYKNGSSYRYLNQWRSQTATTQRPTSGGCVQLPASVSDTLQLFINMDASGGGSIPSGANNCWVTFSKVN